MPHLFTAVARLRFEGVHAWPAAPQDPSPQGHPFAGIEPASWLAHPHRHQFHVEVEVAQTHTDRDVEILALQELVRQHLQTEFKRRSSKSSGAGAYDLGSNSCEMLCSQIAVHLSRKGLHVVRVEVSEDGENGARLHTYPPPADPGEERPDPLALAAELMPEGQDAWGNSDDREREQKDRGAFNVGDRVTTPQGPGEVLSLFLTPGKHTIAMDDGGASPFDIDALAHEYQPTADPQASTPEFA